MPHNESPPFYLWKNNCHADLHTDWYSSDEREWGITFDQYCLLRFRKYVHQWHPREFTSLFNSNALPL